MNEEELLKQYGNVPLHFERYYKFSFSFVSDDGKLRAFAGGDAGDIYRFEVTGNHVYNLSDLPLSVVFYDNKEIYEEY